MVDQRRLFDLIDIHMRMHSCVMLPDLYKLLYQGVFGPSHLIDDPGRAQIFLKTEWEALPKTQNEFLIEPVSIDKSIVRINLFPAKLAGIDIDKLWAALYRSATTIKGSLEQFEVVLDGTLQICRNRKLFHPGSLRQYFRQARKENYPPRHHSEAYRKMNKPAYRVVTADSIEKLIHLN